MAQKEAALAAAADELEAAESAIRGVSARYDRTLARLAEDRTTLAADETEQSARSAELDEAHATAQQAQVAAESQLQGLLAKVGSFLMTFGSTTGVLAP